MTNIPTITVSELKTLRETKIQGQDFILLDVRNPEEHDICDLEGLFIPLKELPSRLDELDKNQKIIIHCHLGGRSHKAAEMLLKAGFKDVSNLVGGIDAWAKEIDHKMTIY